MPRPISRPGKLDQRITILRPTNASDGQGGFTVTKAIHATVWGHVRPRGGGEQSDASKLGAQAVYLFVVRYRSDLQETDILKWNGVEYNIRAILNRTTRALYMEIEGERGVAI